eukprot:g41057.t1
MQDPILLSIRWKLDTDNSRHERQSAYLATPTRCLLLRISISDIQHLKASEDGTVRLNVMLNLCINVSMRDRPELDLGQVEADVFCVFQKGAILSLHQCDAKDVGSMYSFGGTEETLGVMFVSKELAFSVHHWFSFLVFHTFDEEENPIGVAIPDSSLSNGFFSELAILSNPVIEVFEEDNFIFLLDIEESATVTFFPHQTFACSSRQDSNIKVKVSEFTGSKGRSPHCIISDS